MRAVEITEAIERWRSQGRRAVFVRPVSLKGFGSRRSGEVMAVNDEGEHVGEVLGGSVAQAVLEQSRELLEADDPRGSRLLDVAVDGSTAVVAGLACGGRAQLLLETVDALPLNLWPRLKTEQPVALATTLDMAAGSSGRLLVDSAGSEGSVGTAELDAAATREARDMLDSGYPGSRLVEAGAATLLVEAFLPPMRLLVLGAATLADALLQQGELLGWEGSVVDDGQEAKEMVERLGQGDALIAIGHSPGFDGAISAALKKRLAYVGMLGSRAMLGKRRDRIRALGATNDDIARMYAPIGLDLGARTPEETAVAICAEILVNRSGRSSGHLRDQAGPING
jgi:xanthine dehydrogenase accessory factor